MVNAVELSSLMIREAFYDISACKSPSIVFKFWVISWCKMPKSLIGVHEHFIRVYFTIKISTATAAVNCSIAQSLLRSCPTPNVKDKNCDSVQQGKNAFGFFLNSSKKNLKLLNFHKSTLKMKFSKKCSSLGVDLSLAIVVTFLTHQFSIKRNNKFQ